jgi:hypothetical protein
MTVLDAGAAYVLVAVTPVVFEAPPNANPAPLDPSQLGPVTVSVPVIVVLAHKTLW